nr:MAG TPA: hypothetical protein [Caudoviricetes sp.]
MPPKPFLPQPNKSKTIIPFCYRKGFLSSTSYAFYLHKFSIAFQPFSNFYIFLP